jgi:outer membrane protein assembly factor BamB
MMRQWRIAAIGIAAAMLLLVGCGPKGRPADDLLVSTDVADQLGYRIQWQSSLAMPKRTRVQRIVPLGDVIGVVDSNQMLSVIESDDGKARWTARVGAVVSGVSAPRRGEGWITVSVASTAYLYDLDSGELINKVRLANVAAGSAALDGNYAVYGSPTGIVFAEDLRRGVLAWEYQLRGGILTDILHAGNVVVACDSAGTVAAFNPTRGNLLWKKLGPPWKRISANAAANDSFVYVACEDQSLYAFERTTGRSWKYLTQSPLVASPVAIVDRVFQDVPGEGLVCLDAYTGDVLWQAAGVHGQVLMMTKDDRVLIEQPKSLLVLDSETGEWKGTLALPKVDRIATDNRLAGNLYLMDHAGRILKMSPR